MRWKIRTTVVTLRFADAGQSERSLCRSQRRFAAILVLFCSLASGFTQGTVQFNFDGPPLAIPGTAVSTFQYFESGMLFKPIVNSFGRVGANPVAARPDNGTAYLQAAVTDTLMFSFTNGSLFNLEAVDLAEYSTVVGGFATVHFVGYRQDGSIVTTDLITDGIIDGTGPLADFETFFFGPEFSGLTRVEIPNPLWSLDNLRVSIPEPSVGALLLVGCGVLGFMKRRASGSRDTTSRITERDDYEITT